MSRFPLPRGMGVRTERSERARHRDPLAGTQGHHPFPQYLGGRYRQALVALPGDLHDLYHQELDRVLGLPRRVPGGARRLYAGLSPAQKIGLLKRLLVHARGFDARYGTALLPALRVSIREARPLAQREGEGETFLGRFWPFAPRIVDRTHLTPREKRVRVRDPRSVYAVVLHQMAFSRGSDPTRYDRVGSHYAVLPDGTLLQLHPISAYLHASNGFNARSVAVEFAGNFPSTRGRCWQAARYGCHTLTPAQVASGRALLRYLARRHGVTHVLAHRQSSGTRENDPGPDIWSQVGQWGIETLGLKDGGPGFFIGSGNPIPEAWRRWRRP